MEASTDALEIAPRVRQQLRCAVEELSQRGLKQAAKWCAEQLVGLCSHPSPADGDLDMSTDGDETFDGAKACEPPPRDEFLLARTFFDLGACTPPAHNARVLARVVVAR